MRVIEPHQLSSQNKKPKKRNNRLMLGAAVFGVLILTVFLVAHQGHHKDVVDVLSAHVLGKKPPPSSEEYRFLAVPEFESLYRQMSFPNTRAISEPPAITGDRATDERIRAIASSRGYMLTAVPIASITKADNYLLQPWAAEAWQSLMAAAQDESIDLQLGLGYQTIDDQRTVFNQQLRDQKISIGRIAAGEADQQLVAILKTTAIPGYTRQHTGYTIDVLCGDNSRPFEQTDCYKWLSRDNYRNAKQHGWIPSYPEGESQHVGETEPYQFSWVGKSVLLRQ